MSEYVSVDFQQELGKPIYTPLKKGAEQKLTRLYKENGSEKIKYILAIKHLRYITKYVMNQGEGGDLLQNCIVCLYKCIKRYDPDRDARLITFLTPNLRREVQKYIESRGFLKYSHYVYDNMRKVNNADVKLKLLLNEGRLCVDVDMNETVGLTAQRMKTARKVCIAGNSINKRAVYRYVKHEDDFDNQNDISVMLQKMRSAIDYLPDDEKHIITTKYMNGAHKSLRKVAEECNCSHEQARKKEMAGLARLKMAFAV